MDEKIVYNKKNETFQVRFAAGGYQMIVIGKRGRHKRNTNIFLLVKVQEIVNLLGTGNTDRDPEARFNDIRRNVEGNVYSFSGHVDSKGYATIRSYNP